jgi:hypothetical protein
MSANLSVNHSESCFFNSNRNAKERMVKLPWQEAVST